MEEEARTILRSAIEAQQPIAGGKGLGSRIHTSRSARAGLAVIVLDTNVISELMRPQREPRVLAWADGLNPEAVAITPAGGAGAAMRL
jgi:hypothetical protein